jgi:hypothetical protein
LFLILAPGSASPGGAFGAPLSAAADYARMYGLWLFGAAVYSFVLARVGIRGVLDLTRPWRLLLVALALFGGMLSGFRSFVVLSGLTFAILFYLEGLHRTRYAPALLGAVLLGGVVVLPQAEKLPMMVQRSISFLPGNFHFVARESAVATMDWRVGMWNDLLPEVPKRLFLGRGWSFDAHDFYTAVETGVAGDPLAGTILVGNFHNGPLSVVIPLGLLGVLAFGWFLAAGLRVLHRNWKFGSPALRRVNALLLAAFAARTLFFLFCFGSLHSDMAVFVGLLGLSVALNGARASLAQADQPAAGLDLDTEYIRA